MRNLQEREINHGERSKTMMLTSFHKKKGHNTLFFIALERLEHSRTLYIDNCYIRNSVTEL